MPSIFEIPNKNMLIRKDRRRLLDGLPTLFYYLFALCATRGCLKCQLQTSALSIAEPRPFVIFQVLPCCKGYNQPRFNLTLRVDEYTLSGVVLSVFSRSLPTYSDLFRSTESNCCVFAP
jgi:hypothetical protein